MLESAAHRAPSADRVPTLTEVVELRVVHPAPAAVDAAALVQQVLAELTPRIDALFEARLRGALAPAVARAVGGLLVDSRQALGASLRQLVEEAVARSLQAAVGDSVANPGAGRPRDVSEAGGIPCQPDAPPTR